VNKEYTNSWIVNFSADKASSYDKKFYINFAKNIKHKQQVEFIKKYLKYDMKWLDAPIGSGRLMDNIACGNKYGIDRSPFFISMNRGKGIDAIEADLFNVPFEKEFDLITCMHTLFAFDDYDRIIRELVKALKVNGILVCDIVNLSHIEYSNKKMGIYPYNSATTRDKLYDFFDGLNCEVLEIQSHDYFDNRFFSRFFSTYIGNKLLAVINYLYFKFNMYGFLNKYSKGKDEKLFAKYLVAVKRTK
jgi:ubiquinone/menaquinone biosynthesis C-methylase UbiE